MALTLNRSHVYRATLGSTPNVRMLIEADSQTYKIGDLVTLSAGKVAILAAAGNDVTTSGAKVLGIVLRDGRNKTGMTANDVPVLIVNGLELFLPVYHATPTNAKYSDVGLVSTYRLRNQQGVWCLNLAGADGIATVVDKPPAVDPNSLYERVWVRVIDSARALPN